MWRQRARTRWLKGGDRNTRFFHQSASQRRCRNHISELTDSRGQTFIGGEDITSLFEDYFSSLFQTSNPIDFDPSLEGISQVVTADMNLKLTREFTRQEVDTALKQMGPLKASGLYGMGL